MMWVHVQESQGSLTGFLIGVSITVAFDRVASLHCLEVIIVVGDRDGSPPFLNWRKAIWFIHSNHFSPDQRLWQRRRRPWHSNVYDGTVWLTVWFRLWHVSGIQYDVVQLRRPPGALGMHAIIFEHVYDYFLIYKYDLKYYLVWMQVWKVAPDRTIFEKNTSVHLQANLVERKYILVTLSGYIPPVNANLF